MQSFFWGCDTMKTIKAFPVLFLLLLLAFPRTAFADDSDTLSGMGDYMKEISSSGSTDTGFLSGGSFLDAGSSSSDGGLVHPPSDAPLGDKLSGDLVSSVSDSVSSAGGNLAGDLAGNLTENLTGSILGDNVVGDMVSDYLGGAVSDYVSDAVGGYLGDTAEGLLGDLLSISEISSIQETLNNLSSSMQGALVGPNIPHYRILWMFSGESVVDEVKSLFNGDFSNIQEGIGNLKEMF